ncbi:unnamed protein product [Bursaphelenchus xylophilus]|uniref:(pine wood nematode) hypothetical protein n=1 Tax=Bursaphelenchus xylophilus TaxID=6326 RepID=A0A1I7SI54_BURXY|nr:unnamed protein product [Bursaphelenchus xylophilus]CAG9084935.1 unnamed protein product [Bursaphelenchus xylophilus]
MGKLVIPPNAKYQPQDPDYVTGDTTSKDPSIMRARAFVGCLNTDTCTRESIIHLFSMYGPLRGVTHFKSQGYGFVQFEREEDAVDAVENLHMFKFHGFELDVKIATPTETFLSKEETGPKRPRSKRGGRKERERRMAASGTVGFQRAEYGRPSNKGYDYDQYNDGNSPGAYRQSAHNSPRPIIPNGGRPSTSNAALETPHEGPTVDSAFDLTPHSELPLPPKFRYQRAAEEQEGSVFVENEIPDVLICGGCHLITANAQFFLEHRVRQCDRKVVVKGEDEPEYLKCYSCKIPCKNSWDLINHMSQAHKLNLYNKKDTSTLEYPDHS